MRLKTQIVLIVTLFGSCSTNSVFDSFRSINHIELLGNTSKWETGYFDEDSNIVLPLIQDTFHIYFDIDKKNRNALIFSLGKIDTVGNLSFENQTVYFKPKNHASTYKMFDFNAKVNDSWIIENCGPLMNSILNIEETRNYGDEIIQVIRVHDKSKIPPLRQTLIQKFSVSSKYGIIEMDIRVGWAEQDINLKNAP